MKTIIYGNTEPAITRVEKIVQEFVEFPFLVKSEGNSSLIADFEEANVSTVIFVGISPVNEIREAISMNMKVFVLLAPVEASLLELVTIGKVKGFDEVEALKGELRNFFDEKAKELKQEEAC